MPRKVKANLNVLLDPDRLQRLKDYAKAHHTTVPKLVREFVDRYLTEDDVTPVLLKVPKSLVGKQPDLENWLAMRAVGIVKVLRSRYSVTDDVSADQSDSS